MVRFVRLMWRRLSHMPQPAHTTTAALPLSAQDRPTNFVLRPLVDAELGIKLGWPVSARARSANTYVRYRRATAHAAAGSNAGSQTASPPGVPVGVPQVQR